MSEHRKKRRTTQQVKDDIMQAVGNVLSKYGVSKLAVESVASEAGMDKAMLYRHFKDFNDILIKYVEQEDFWLNFLNEEPEIKDNTDLIPYLSQIFEKQLNELLDNRQLQGLITWELVDKSQMIMDIANRREEMASAILEGVQKKFPYANVSSNNMLAIISAGIFYLVIHKDISSFCGVDLNNKEHQADFVSDLNWLVEKVFTSSNEAERIAINCLKKGMDEQLISEVTGLSISKIQQLI